MARDTTPNYEPHLTENSGNWYVRMKTAPGEYVVLSEPHPIKRYASRELRRIRQDMAKSWFEKRGVASP